MYKKNREIKQEFLGEDDAVLFPLLSFSLLTVRVPQRTII